MLKQNKNLKKTLNHNKKTVLLQSNKETEKTMA